MCGGWGRSDSGDYFEHGGGRAFGRDGGDQSDFDIMGFFWLW